MRPVLILLTAVVFTPAGLQAQFQTTPDTTAQISQAGDTLQTVYWAQPVTPRRHQLFVHNRSDHPVYVRGFTLSSCVGLPLPSCGTHEATVALAAHQTARLGEVTTRRNIAGGFRYHVALATAP